MGDATEEETVLPLLETIEGPAYVTKQDRQEYTLWTR
jgi:hypothetical protein